MWNLTNDVETRHLWLAFSIFDTKTEEISFLTSLLKCGLRRSWGWLILLLRLRQNQWPRPPPCFQPLCSRRRLWCESTRRSSESRWDRNPLTELWSPSGGTDAALPRLWRHNGGEPPNGKAKEITSQTWRGAPAVFREERAGLLSVANAGRQRPVGGQGRMSSEHELLRMEEKRV